MDGNVNVGELGFFRFIALYGFILPPENFILPWRKAVDYQQTSFIRAGCLIVLSRGSSLLLVRFRLCCRGEKAQKLRLRG